MAATRRMLMQNRMVSPSSLLSSVAQKSSSACCSTSLGLRQLPALESACQASTAVRCVSAFAAKPPAQAGGSVGRKERYPVRRMSAGATAEPTTGSDIIDKVKKDHEELEESYSNYKKAHKRGEEDEARTWFNQFVWEISLHAVSEELVLYPLLAAQGDRGKELADKSRADHQATKNILEELQNTTDSDVSEQKMDKMMSELREHIQMEEKEDLVYLQENVGRSAREAAGTSFSLGKNLVPTRPHAGVPNKPAALESALGLLVTPIDKLRDTFTAFPNKN